MKKTILFALLLVLPSFCVLLAQEPLNIDTTQRSLYSGLNFQEELYRFAGDEDVEQMVDAICRASGKERNFQLVNANVPNVAAIVANKSGYLLYNRRYFFDNKPNRTLMFAVLAQEVGHLLLKHQLNDRSRVREETQADEFMGQALMRLDSSAQLASILNVIRNIPFSYTRVPWAEREKAIRRGWERASALMEGPGFGVNDTNIESLPLPRFVIKGCPERISLNKNRFARCRNLQDVDITLCRALDKKGYNQRSYFCIKNGFALVTGIEQFNVGGTSVTGNTRWQDCPRQDGFEGIMDYLSSLISPQPGRYRVFVFIVTDQPRMEYEQGCLNADQAKDWLRKGGDWLPKSLGKKAYSSRNAVRVLVYEFKAPESTLRIKEECRDKTPILSHLKKSGILVGIRS